jgi:hypothetical protein
MLAMCVDEGTVRSLDSLAGYLGGLARVAQH